MLISKNIRQLRKRLASTSRDVARLALAEALEPRTMFSLLGVAVDYPITTVLSQVDGSLSRSHHGTGLGLFLVRELAELHGGTISVDSEVGRGSRFTVTLPVSAPVPVPVH